MRLLTVSLIGLALLVSGANTALAAQVLTLDDCVELALKNRASIIQARGAETMAKWDKVAALGAFLPQLNASYYYSDATETDREIEQFVPTEFDTIAWNAQVNGEDSTVVTFQGRDEELMKLQLGDEDRTSKSLDFRASLTLDVSNWFAIQAASANKARAHLDVIGSEQDLILSVKAAYYLYLAAAERVAVDEQAVERSREQLKLIESKFELGSANKSDLLKQKVQVGNDRLAYLEAQNAVTTTRADLAYTVGINPNSDVEFSTDYTVRGYDGSLQDAMSFGLEHRPSLLAAEKAVDAARHNVRSRWSDYLPSATGFWNYSISDGTRGDTLTFDFSSRSRSIGFQLNWSIFDGFWRERQLASAKVSHNNARAILADERNYTASSIKTAYFEIERLRETKVVAQENVDAANEDMKITQEKYNLGAATILDLLDAQVSLKQAQVALIRADFDLNLAIARLENAMGKA